MSETEKDFWAGVDLGGPSLLDRSAWSVVALLLRGRGMSDHSKPRRWTLAIPAASRSRELIPRVLQLTSVLFSDEERVPVREDCITEADVEAVAIWLFEQELPSERVTSAEWNWANDSKVADDFRDRAQSLLARIFEDGEQQS